MLLSSLDHSHGKKKCKHMTNISCNTHAASIQKYEETSPIKMEIKHGNSLLSLFYHGLTIYFVIKPSLSLLVKQCDIISGQPVVKQ